MGIAQIYSKFLTCPKDKCPYCGNDKLKFLTSRPLFGGAYRVLYRCESCGELIRRKEEPPNKF